MIIIAGKHKGRKLSVPREGVRPTSGRMRETLFNICQQEIEGAEFLDLFAGAGAIGLEALSRGARHVTFIENDKAAVRIIQKNLATLEEESCATIIHQDALEALKRLRGRFDIIFADPPYGEGHTSRVLRLLDTSPLLKEEGRLFLEDNRFDEVPLHTLELVKERRQGSSLLREYRRIPSL